MEFFIAKNKWLVLLFGAVIQIFAGIPAAWGVFQKSVESEYALNQQATSLIFSFTIAAFGVGCILGGALQDKASPRIACIIGGILLAVGFVGSGFLPPENALALYLVFSVNVGMGCAFLYPSVMSCVQKWYADKKGLATGVVGGAVGLSGIMLATVGRFLIKTTGIRGCFITLGVTLLVLACLGAVVMVNPTGENAPKAKLQQKSFTPLEMLKTRQYYLVFAVVCLATPAVLLFSPTIIQLGQDRGLTENVAVLSIAIGSVASAFGRVLCPVISDKIGRKNMDIILLASLGLLSIAFIFAQNIFVIVVYCMLTFCYSGEAAVIPSLATDLYGFSHSGVNYGLLALGMSVGSVGFPLLVTVFGGENEIRHIFAIAAAFLGVVVLLFLKPIQGEKL